MLPILPDSHIDAGWRATAAATAAAAATATATAAASAACFVQSLAALFLRR